jgi:hypothetical protein
MKVRFVIVGIVTAALLGACNNNGGTSPTTASSSANGPSAAVSSAPAASGPSLGSEPLGAPADVCRGNAPIVSPFADLYGWAVPSPAADLPTAGIGRGRLFAVCAGDHPEGQPAYNRVTFHFHGARPPVTLGYAPEVLSGGKPTKLPLEGNAFLRLLFRDVDAPESVFPLNQPVGLARLRSWGCGGLDEGRVTCGLGLQVAPASDQRPPIHAGYLIRDPDGTGQHLDYTLAFDVPRN